MDIKIDDKALQENLHAALMLSLPEAARKKMVEEALKDLLTPKRTGYSGTEQSSIQRVFTAAIETEVKRIATEAVRADPTLSIRIAEHVNVFSGMDDSTERLIIGAIVAALIARLKDVEE
jgi:hypothetical protein